MRLIDIKKTNTDKKYLKEYKLTYLNKKNNIKEYNIVSRNEIKTKEDLGNKVLGAVIIATNDKNEILLLKEFRMALNKEIINLCSGMMDKNETIEECARRELFEETGIKDIEIIKILNPSFASSGISDEKIQIVFVKVKDRNLISDENTSENEKIKAKFYSKKEVKMLLKKEEFASNSQLICELFANGLFI